MEEVTINDIPLSDYGVIMLAGSYASLLKPTEGKEWVMNDDPRKSGVDYIIPSRFIAKERNVDLIFGITGSSKDDFIAKYTTFISLLQNGILKLYVPYTGKFYHLKYESCTSFDDFTMKDCKIAVKFLEPDPTNNGA